MEKMRACVFHGKDKIRVEEVERPRADFGEAAVELDVGRNFRHAHRTAGTRREERPRESVKHAGRHDDQGPVDELRRQRRQEEGVDAGGHVVAIVPQWLKGDGLLRLQMVQSALDDEHMTIHETPLPPLAATVLASLASAAPLDNKKDLAAARTALGDGVVAREHRELVVVAGGAAEAAVQLDHGQDDAN